ncbi:MAG TPA: ribbon-helix-helix domain-containing protein [Candidatus Bathyarchaeia archaeon]|nr:ribbon-helix-helix domain-containing protein [Candidatus Bathyarchaeia archaeon]
MARELESPYWIHPLMMFEGMELSLGHRSERRVNITATLPLEFLERIDELIEDNAVPSRSFVIREAVKKYLKDF